MAWASQQVGESVKMYKLRKFNLLTEFAGAVDATALMQFVDQGGNLVVAASPTAAPLTRDVIAQIGLDLSDEGLHVWDFQHALATGLP